LHQVADLFELNVKLRCQKFNSCSLHLHFFIQERLRKRRSTKFLVLFHNFSTSIQNPESKSLL